MATTCSTAKVDRISGFSADDDASPLDDAAFAGNGAAPVDAGGSSLGRIAAECRPIDIGAVTSAGDRAGYAGRKPSTDR